MSTLFVFGAGASHGSGACTPSNPPLGSKLFSELRALGGVASVVSHELANLFERDFEAGMEQFWKEHNTLSTALLRDMARYFAQFESIEGNLYLELIRAMGGTRKKAVFATTNYDMLIEHAARLAGLLVTYGGLPTQPNNIPILKIHGSCNFLPNVQPRQISGISFDLSAAGPGASIFDAGVKPATSAKDIVDFCLREESVAPALALYSPSKQVLFCRSFINHIQGAWREAIQVASRIYIIGLRVHLVDDHIWKPLSKAHAPIYYVGYEPNEFNEWSKTSRSRQRSYVLARTFSEALPLIARHHK